VGELFDLDSLQRSENIPLHDILLPFFVLSAFLIGWIERLYNLDGLLGSVYIYVVFTRYLQSTYEDYRVLLHTGG